MKKLLTLAVLLISCMVFAETTPIMLSLVTPVQWPDKDVDVTGLRLSLLYGECDNFKGLDIGLINRTNGDFSGLAIGGGNIVDGTIQKKINEFTVDDGLFNDFIFRFDIRRLSSMDSNSIASREDRIIGCFT